MRPSRNSQVLLVALCLSLLPSACKPREAKPKSSNSEVFVRPGTESPLQHLERFFATSSNYHLPTQEDVASNVEFAGRDDPGFAVGDTNRDGRPDLVAVLVSGQRFNVAIFHGESSGWTKAPVWIVRDDTEVIGGVLLEGAFVIPLYCSGCDSNPAYRWIGSEYDFNVHLVGESACVGADVPVYENPTVTSVVLGLTTKAADVRILEIGRRVEKSRWYRVKLVNEDGREGFVESRYFPEEIGLCE